jgi:hypothetical protein
MSCFTTKPFGFIAKSFFCFCQLSKNIISLQKQACLCFKTLSLLAVFVLTQTQQAKAKF